MPKLFERKSEDDHVRVWVPGCATGEEAYSIAMLLAEHSASVPGSPAIQLFATDIDEAAVAFAREGLYTLNDAADVSPERLRRFFVKEGKSYRVRKELREMMLFAHHNLIKDPPFSHLDLASCRNLLIYLNRAAQKRVIEIIHFALNAGGFLLLGSSESVEGSGDLFVSFDKDASLFQSRAMDTRLAMSLPHASVWSTPGWRPHEERASEQRARERLSAADLHLRLLEQYAPPSIVVNQDHEIVHLSETAGRYMRYGGGDPSHNLLKTVRPELRIELRTALYQAAQQRTNVEAPGLVVHLDGRTVTVNLIVRPVIREDDTARGFFLVIFREMPEGLVDTARDQATPLSSGDPARQLEEEVVRVKAQLRATIERHETQAEELEASNEELQAMNEELRSSAEELETSKEELQSLNEELRTVNQELKIKIEEQAQANDDIQNLINSTDIGTIFLDRASRIKLFTPRARAIFTLIPADRGRPLSDISTTLVGDDLPRDIERVLDRLERVQREVRTRDDSWWLMRALPYRTADDRIDGVVLTFVDITEHKRVEEALRASEERLRRAIAIETVGVVFFNADGVVTDANNTFLRMNGYSRDDVKLGSVRLDQMTPPAFSAQLKLAIDELLQTGKTDTHEQQYVRKNGSRWWGMFTATRLGPAEGAGFVVDVSRRKRIEDQLGDSEDRVRLIMESASDFAIFTTDATGIIDSWNQGASQMFGWQEDRAIGRPGGPPLHARGSRGRSP